MADPEGESQPDPAPEEVRTEPSPEEREQVAQAARSGAGMSIDELRPDDAEAIAGVDAIQDIELKRWYAQGLFILLTAQLFVTNGVFVAYAWAGRGWDVQPDVMKAWLAATVVELIGIVAVVTRYLFPRRDAQQD
jgi:hypothetical protein